MYSSTSVQTFFHYKSFCQELFSHCKLPILFTDYLPVQSNVVRNANDQTTEKSIKNPTMHTQEEAQE